MKPFKTYIEVDVISTKAKAINSRDKSLEDLINETLKAIE